MEVIKVMPKALKKQPEETDVLWKYMTFQKFVSILLNKEFHYTRLDQLEDTLEGINQRYLSTLSFHKQNCDDPIINTNHPFYEKYFFDETLKQKEDKFITNQMHNFVISWITSSRESAGMWNLYSEPGGVSLRILFKDLRDLLAKRSYVFDVDDYISEIDYGLVEYKDFIDQHSISSESFKVSNTAFRKDISFEHEKEFRISVKTKRLLSHDSKGIKQTFDGFDNIPFQVVVHPKSTEWQINNVTKLVNQFMPLVAVRLSELRLR